MLKIKKSFLILTMSTLMLSMPAMGLGVNASADNKPVAKVTKSDVIDDKKPEAIDGGSNTGSASQKPTGPYNDNKNIDDNKQNSIATTVSDNAYVDDKKTDYHLINTDTPTVTPTWGDYTRVSDMSAPNSYSSIDSVNTGKVTFQTKWFFPLGFHVGPSEHGNYQGAVMANGSIYFVESAGTNTNKGAIVKLKMDALDSLGIDATSQQDLMAKVFNFFNRKSTYGEDNNKQLSDYIVKTNSYRTANNKLQPKANKLNKIVTAFNKKNKRILNIYANAKKKMVSKINAQMKANRKAAAKIRKQHPKTKKKKHLRAVKLSRLYKTYKALKASKNKPVSLSAKNRRAYAQVQRANRSYMAKDKKQLAALQKKINANNKKIDKITQDNELFKQYFQLSKLIEISPVTNIGHGQTLSYNPSNNHIYIAQDDELGVVGADFYNQVTEMDSDTMRPVHIYRFKLNNNDHYYAIHTLAFDNEGNAYFGIHQSPDEIKNAYTLFRGTMSGDTISFSPVRGLINWPASYNQQVTFNRVNNRLYLLSNDMIVSIPVDEVRNDDIKPQDVHYVTFNTNREFESLSFDENGYGYLMMLWRSELLKSNVPLD
ncbi:MAG: hypothetical protein M3Z82_08050 [Apilactobacillus sp.]|nr:hypothetical protein [Apilactobacillus sp.]CAI2627425.1 hypothetical protein AKUA1404_02490 [Apilactobacillus kunkeei]